MEIYCENCKKTHQMHTSKKLNFNIRQKISNINIKSKYAKCLADRAFADKINDEYDLEQLVKRSFLYL